MDTNEYNSNQILNNIIYLETVTISNWCGAAVCNYVCKDGFLHTFTGASTGASTTASISATTATTASTWIIC